MKIVFMGTPEFAATILEGLINEGHEITAVYTQPDRAQGRSKALVASKVKEVALSHNLPVYQPEKIKRPEEVEILKSIPADVFVVAAYGQILSEEILNIARFGAINVHGSLLPKLRGSSPIQRAIANGDSVTGVTIMQMDKGIDSGDIFAKAEVEITREDNENTMYQKLADAGSLLLVTTLKDIEAGKAVKTAQNHQEATYAPMLTKDDGRLDINKPAILLEHIVKGYLSWPTAYLEINGGKLKVYDAYAYSYDEAVNMGVVMDKDNVKPGFFALTKKHLFITTGDGFLELLSVQPEGKKPMKGTDYANGQHILNGMSMGN